MLNQLCQLYLYGPAGNIFQAIADLVDYARLHLGIREHTGDSFGKTFQIVDTGNQDVFYATILQISQYSQPEIGPSLSDTYIPKSSLWPLLTIYRIEWADNKAFAAVLLNINPLIKVTSKKD